MSGGMARTIRSDSLELWRGLVLHGMGEVDFHVFWKYWKLTSSPNTSKWVLRPPDIFWEWRTRYFLGVAHTVFFLEWRTRYLFGMAHTKFVGCGAHVILLGVAHTVFVGCGAHGVFWVWRTRYLLGVAHSVSFGCGAHGKAVRCVLW